MIARVYSVSKVHATAEYSEEKKSLMITVQAEGRTNIPGWTNPQLGVWSYIGEPVDGILGLDFLAEPPVLKPGTYTTVNVTDINTPVFSFPIPAWVRGVRVHAAINELEQPLAHAPMVLAKVETTTGEGMPLPWPFPWYTPKAEA